MRRFVLLAGLVLVLAGGVASAEEIIYFANGSTMPVLGHEVDGESIRLDLGPDGSLTIPLVQIDRIVAAGREVFPGNADPANRIVEPSGERSYPVRGRRPGRYNQRRASTPTQRDPGIVTQDSNGTAVYRPFAGGSNASMRTFGAAGHELVLDADPKSDPNGGMPGTRQIGARNVVDTTGMMRKGKVTGLDRAPGSKRRGNSGAAKPAKPKPASGDSGDN